MVPRSFCSPDASGDASNTVFYSHHPPCGSSERAARNLDADNSFSIPLVSSFLLVSLCLVCTVTSLVSCSLAYIPLTFFPLSQSGDRFAHGSPPFARFRHDARGARSLCACACVFYCREPPAFFLPFCPSFLLRDCAARHNQPRA